MPTLTVFGGPNGSGNAIAKRMDPSNPRRAAVAAGREVIRRTREYLENRESFAIEATLASRSTVTTMLEAEARGFIVQLVYVCVDNPERSIKRVRERTARGGHFVPDEDVRRRYERSLQNLPDVLRQAHEAVVFENSGGRPRKVLETQAGVIVWRADKEPGWVTRVREMISSTEPT